MTAVSDAAVTDGKPAGSVPSTRPYQPQRGAPIANGDPEVDALGSVLALDVDAQERICAFVASRIGKRLGNKRGTGSDE